MPCSNESYKYGNAHDRITAANTIYATSQHELSMFSIIRLTKIVCLYQSIKSQFVTFGCLPMYQSLNTLLMFTSGEKLICKVESFINFGDERVWWLGGGSTPCLGVGQIEFGFLSK